jgi:hypothetical protein
MMAFEKANDILYRTKVLEKERIFRYELSSKANNVIIFPMDVPFIADVRRLGFRSGLYFYLATADVDKSLPFLAVPFESELK